MGRKGGNKRRFNKNRSNNQGQDGYKKFKGEESFTEWAYNHPIFEAYYRVNCHLHFTFKSYHKWIIHESIQIF